jgi:predicted AlkP superfamily phosphohydrolase/phosphomutase
MDKTLLVGWDAACWEYLEPMLAAGRLPALQGLIDRGVHGVLLSTMPPWTPTAWATILTGTQPGKHGVFDMLHRVPGSYAAGPTNSAVRQGTPFWEYLNARGVRTGLVNVPFSHPTGSPEGFVICGFGTPESVERLGFPDEVTGLVRGLFPDFKPAVAAQALRSADPAHIFDVEREQQRRFNRIAAVLLERYPVDVLVVNLLFPDHANHKLPEMSQVEAAYAATDADLQDLIDVFGPDNILLISDHGSSRLKGDFYLGGWLQDAGFLVEMENDRAEQAAALNWLLLQFFREDVGWRGPIEKLARGVLRRVLPRLSAGLQTRAWERIERDHPGARGFVRWSGRVDPRRSQVIPGSVFSGLLYLNVAGREPEGIVPAERRLALAEELRDRLLDVQDPETGQRLFTRVHLREEIYAGPELEQAPDLILDAYDARWNIRTSRFVSLPGRAQAGYFYRESGTRDYGWHSREGVYLLSGPAFAGPGRGEPAALADIPATLLHIYDVPIPTDWDGRVLLPMLSADRRAAQVSYQEPAARPAAGEPGYSEADVDKLTDHLRALGYLD